MFTHSGTRSRIAPHHTPSVIAELGSPQGGKSFLSIVGFLVLGCSIEDGLRTRAAFDLKCKEKRVTITDLDGPNRGVSGCGRQATYTFSRDSRSWVLNSQVTEIEGKD